MGEVSVGNIFLILSRYIVRRSIFF